MVRFAGVDDAANTKFVAKRFLDNRSAIGLLMCLPMILLIGGLVIYPALYAIYLSMLNKTMTTFVWFDNFTFLLHRSTFRQVIWQTAFFAVTSVIGMSLVGFVLALLMHNIPMRTQRVWRGFLLIPWVIPLSMSTLTWWWLLDPSYSAVNWMLVALGMEPVSFLGEGWSARLSTIAVRIWQGAPFFMIMYLAGLKAVPEHLYEAAAIDGAGPVQKLIYVTIPMMSNTIAITMLFGLMTTFAEFDIVRILTNGGPQDKTHVFATYAFQVGLSAGDIPLGAANSLFMLPVLSLLAFFVLRGVMRRGKEIGA